MAADWAGSRGTAGFERQGLQDLGARALKRGTDVVGAVLLALVLLPVLLAAVLAVRLTSPGRAIFRQQRVGRDGQPFVMLKLRTMRADSADGLHREYVARLLHDQVRPVDGLYKLPLDPRVTRVGAWLRRTSIDEIPQLWNVLRGEMSLIGPRPALTWEVDLFPPWALRRFEVRPGLSGLWQVSGRNRLTMTQGLALDVRYVEEQSFLLDLTLMVRSVGAVLGGGTR